MMIGYDHAIVAAAGAILGAAGREMFNWIADKIFHRKNGNGNGVNGLTSATRRDVQDIFETTIKSDVMPEIKIQTEILKGIAGTNKSMNDNIITLVALSGNKRKIR